MTSNSILWLLLAIGLSAGVAYYQYFRGFTPNKKLQWTLGSLRFLSVLALLLLLINPRILRTWYEPEKSPLVVLLDNSSSIAGFKADAQAQEVFDKIRQHQKIQERFDVRPYLFDVELSNETQADFKGKQTRIQHAAQELQKRYRNSVFPTVLISDGNATSGGDYVYAFGENKPVYSVVLGDTTRVSDLRITQVNANKYAFLKNRFPVEIFAQYSGTKKVKTQLEIRQSGKAIHKEILEFGPEQRSVIRQITLPAEKLGVQVLEAVVGALEGEKNTFNNVKKFAIEVIDQHSEIALITDINHPDISVLKRAIQSNSQRKVSVLSPSEVGDISKYNLLIFYQPNASFSPLIDKANQAQSNCWFITGKQTDFNLLNNKQQIIQFRMGAQPEHYGPIADPSFSLFVPEALAFSEFPPLEHPFGTVKVAEGFQREIESEIRQVKTDMPILGLHENGRRRIGFLLGEGIWRWRLQHYVQQQSFEAFDRFVDKNVQFLVSDNSRKNLVVQHERFYHMGEPVLIHAQYFDKNYEFDTKARLNITLTERSSKKTKTYDLLRSSDYYVARFDDLPSGVYDFRVKELGSNASYTGSFELLDFDMEKQFVNPDYDKLQQLGQHTGGGVYLFNQVDSLIQHLLESDRFPIVEKKVSKRLPLIDQWYLLIALALTLGVEWFLRKYNGML